MSTDFIDDRIITMDNIITTKDLQAAALVDCGIRAFPKLLLLLIGFGLAEWRIVLHKYIIMEYLVRTTALCWQQDKVTWSLRSSMPFHYLWIEL